MPAPFLNTIYNFFYVDRNGLQSKNKNSATRKFYAKRRLANVGYFHKMPSNIGNKNPDVEQRKYPSILSGASCVLPFFNRFWSLLSAVPTVLAESDKQIEQLYFTTRQGNNTYAITITDDIGLNKYKWLNTTLSSGLCNITLNVKSAGKIGDTLASTCEYFLEIGGTLDSVSTITISTVNNTTAVITDEINCLINTIYDMCNEYYGYPSSPKTFFLEISILSLILSVGFLLFMTYSGACNPQTQNTPINHDVINNPNEETGLLEEQRRKLSAG